MDCISSLNDLKPNVNVVIERLAYNGWSVPERIINDHEIVLILGGNGKAKITDRIYDLHSGVLLYFKPGVVHSIDSSANSPLYFLASHFSLNNNIELPLMYVNNINNIYKAKDIFFKLYKIWLNKNWGWQWQQNILLESLLFELLSDINRPVKSHANIKRLEIVVSYISIHYKEDITLEDLCSIVKLSKGYLSNIFKSEMGRSPLDYINQYRIDRTKELLINSSKKISDIALENGFNDPLYYTRLFKKNEGLCPTEFKKLYIANK